jgi:hypothetical protein
MFNCTDIINRINVFWYYLFFGGEHADWIVREVTKRIASRTCPNRNSLTNVPGQYRPEAKFCDPAMGDVPVHG